MAPSDCPTHTLTPSLSLSPSSSSLSLFFPSLPTSPFSLPFPPFPFTSSLTLPGIAQKAERGAASGQRSGREGKGKVGCVRAPTQFLHIYAPSVLVSFQQGTSSASAWQFLGQVAQNLLRNPPGSWLLQGTCLFLQRGIRAPALLTANLALWDGICQTPLRGAAVSLPFHLNELE